MILHRSIISTIAISILLALTSGISFATVIRPVEGPVILARSGAVEIYLWDASSYIAQLISDRTLGTAGMRALEASATLALAAKAKSSETQTMTISVFYRPLAANSIYGAATFSGQQKLCAITASRAAIKKNGYLWAQSIANGKVPPQVKLAVVGQLPPAR